MAKQQPSYTKEFKQEAVQLVETNKARRNQNRSRIGS